MKKKIALMLVFCAVLALFSGCANKDDTVINVTALKGSTGMGMAKLMADAPDNYRFALSSDASDVMTKVISGEYDIAALPTNSAAIAYAKTAGEGQIQMLAINTLGVLYLLQRTDETPAESLSDLRGQTIVAMGQGANPEYVLNFLLEANGLALGEDVTVEWKATVDEVLAAIVAGSCSFAMLPEPNVSVALSKNSDYGIAFDLTEEWNASTVGELVMGCLVVRHGFAQAHPAAVAQFLKDYKASIDFILTDDSAPEVIAAQDIVPAEGVARKALPNCHIVCITGEEMKPTIDAYYEMLFRANPQAVGGAVPDDGFYYVGR